MKLRNLFLVGLAACTLASCSKDEAVDSGPKEPVDASISITASALMTKASVDSNETELLNNEKYVQILTAYVFRVPTQTATDEQKVLAGMKSIRVENAPDYLKDPITKSLIGIDHITVKITPNEKGTSDDVFSVVLVANCRTQNITNLKELKAATITSDISNYAVVFGQTYLPMKSKEMKLTGLAPNVKTSEGKTTYIENWYNGSETALSIENSSDSYTSLPSEVKNAVPMDRMVARVQVEKVVADIQKNYSGATFELCNLSIANVRRTSSLEGGNGTWVKGFQSDGFGESSNPWLYPDSSKDWVTYMQVLGRSYLDGTKGKLVPENIGLTWDNTDPNKFFAYAFSNSDEAYKTALLISGRFYRNSSDKVGEIRNFRVFLEDTEGGAADPGIKVLANHVYKLTVTITGEGSPNEDEILVNAHVGITIQVNPWNVIEQTESDAN